MATAILHQILFIPLFPYRLRIFLRICLYKLREHQCAFQTILSNLVIFSKKWYSICLLPIFVVNRQPI